MGWLALLSVLVVKVAVSVLVPVSATAAVDTPEPQSPTEPVWLATALLPGLAMLTVAVKVTDLPNTEGLTEVSTLSLHDALPISWLIDGEAALALKLPSPLV